MKKKDLIAKRGHKCECCGNTHWLNNLIPLEIHHVLPPSDKEVDLQLLCPNCHASTPNYRGRGIKTAKNISDQELSNAAENSTCIRQLLVKLGLVAKGGNYEVIRKRLVVLGLSEKFKARDAHEVVCLHCGFTFISTEKMKFCSQACSNKHNSKFVERKTKIQWPNCEVLKKLTDTYGFVEAGKRLGVSDNAIRKHLKTAQ